MAQYGKQAWGSGAAANSRGQDSNREKFYKFVDGMNTLRILTEPYRYFTHKVKFEGDPNKFDRTLRCADPNGCPLCEEGNQQKAKYIVAALIRGKKGSELKYVEFGTKIYNDIETLMGMPAYADVRAYDITVIRNPKGGATNFYQVVPQAPTPLSAKDIEAMESVDTEELEKLCEPVTRESVEQSIRRIAGWIKKQNSSGGEQEQAAPAVVAQKPQQQTQAQQQVVPVVQGELASAEDQVNFTSIRK